MTPRGPEDAFSSVAWTLALVLAVLVALLVAQIVVMRMLLSYRKRRRARFRSTWEPILAACIDSYPARLPPLRRREVTAFLALWNHFQESVLEHAKERLNRIARRLHVDEAASDRLNDGDVGEQLLALTALGHLRERDCWTGVLSCVDSPDLALSLCAARALVRIDCVEALKEIAPRIAQRADWPAAGIAAVLVEAGPDVLSRPLADAAETASAGTVATLVRLLELAHPHIAGPVIGRILRGTHDPGTLGACLRVVQDPAQLDVVRALLTDERWQIRVQAASALGRLGTHEDVPLLVRALGDEQWWVRYRAAQALAHLPSVGLGQLRALAATVADRYGRDMMRQIVAEQELLAC